MQCGVCGSGEPVKRCTTCKQLLCKQHVTGCQGCGKALCPDHRVAAPDGRTVCANCMSKAQQAAPAESLSFESLTADEPLTTPAAPPVAPASAPPQVAASEPTSEPASTSFSFEDLAREGGQLPGSQPNDPDAPALVNPITGVEEVPDPEVDRKLAMMLGEDEGGIRMEALGGSNRGTPIWLSGFYAGGIALLLAVPLAIWTGFDDIQPWYSYCTMLVAAGAVIYGFYGFFQKDDPPKERNLSIIAIVLGFAAAFIALIYRGAPPA